MSIGTNIEFANWGTDKLHPLGTRIEGSGGLVYRYAYNAGADTLAAGEIIGGSQTATVAYGRISGTAADIIDGSSSVGLGLGMALAAVPTANYCWVQTQGPNQAAITTDGNVAAGSALTIGGTTSPDGTLIPMGAGTEEMVIAHALAADSSTTSAVGSIVLNCDCRW